MAIDPSTAFPGKIDTTTDPAGYPFGKAQDITTPGDKTGTPWVAQLLNDIFGFQQALLKEPAVPLVPSGTPDKVGASQYLDALKTIITETSGGAGVWGSVVEIEDSDLTANKYTLSVGEIEAEALYVFTGTNASAEFVLPAIATAQNKKNVWFKNDSTDDTRILLVTPNAADVIDRKVNKSIAVKEGATKLTEMDNTGFTNVTKQWVSS